MGVSFNVSGPSGLGTIQLPLTLNALIASTLASGAGAAGKVNQLYQTQGTLAASASVDIDLYAFGGALDAAGNAYTMATVKLLIIQVIGATTVTEADYIKVGGKGTTAGWTSAFGTNTDTLKIFSGPATASGISAPGTFILWDIGATGYVVGSSTTNHILTLTAGANTGTVTYNVIVVGATS